MMDEPRFACVFDCADCEQDESHHPEARPALDRPAVQSHECREQGHAITFVGINYNTMILISNTLLRFHGLILYIEKQGSRLRGSTIKTGGSCKLPFVRAFIRTQSHSAYVCLDNRLESTTLSWMGEHDLSQ